MANNHEMRRQPKQSRGQLRIESIIEATEHLLCEMDFDRITTNHIAKQANTSVGVMYRYFPNKYAVFAEMAQRDMQRVEELQYSCLSQCNSKNWKELSSQFIVDFAEHYRTRPAYVVLWRGLNANTSTRHLRSDMLQRLTRNHIQLSDNLTPNLGEPEKTMVARLLISTLHSMLSLVLDEAKRSMERYEAILEQYKVMLTVYLQHVIEQHQTDNNANLPSFLTDLSKESNASLV